MKLKVNDVMLDPIRVGDRLEFRFDAPEDLQYVTIEKDDFIGDLELSEIQLEQSTLATTFVEPMESETVTSGIFKSVQGLSYEITNPNSDTWASIKQSVDGSITTYHNETLQSTISHTIEDIIFGISDIAGDDESSFNLRLDGIESSVKNEMYHSVRTQLADFVGFEISDLEGNVNTIQNTVDRTVQRIEDTEGNVNKIQITADATAQSLADLEGNYNNIVSTVNYHSQTIGSDGGNLARKVMNDRLFQINVIDEIAGAKSSYTQLANQIGLRVGDSQITIGGEGIIIDAESIYLNDSTQIKDGIITNRMVAANAGIDGAKIQDATIGSAKIANLDAGKITTGELRGIRVYAKIGEIGDWNLDSGVLYSQLRSGLNTTIKATGDVALAAGAPNPRDTAGATFQLWHSGRLRWLDNSGDTTGDIETRGGRLYYSGYSMELDRILLPRSTFIGRDSNNEMSIQNAGSLTIYPGASVYFRTDAVRPYVNNYAHLGGANYRWSRVWTVDGVSESSDVRLKNNIVDIPSKLLNGISQVEPKMYEMNGKTKFGYIAQDVERELFKYATQVVGSKNASEYMKQFDVLDKNDESYQALIYSQMEVLKGAYRDKKIEELENRIKELENAS